MAEELTPEEIEKKDMENELAIKRMMNEASETNKKLDDDYDEKMRRLEAKKRLLPTDNEPDNAMSQSQARLGLQKEKLNELKSRISDARREGKDVFIAELLLRNINAKLKLAEVSGEDKDFKTVEEILRKAGLELEEALGEKELNVKKEIEEKLRATS